MNYFVLLLILIGFVSSLQLSFAEMSYPDAIKIPFNDSDLVLVGTIISKEEISKNQTKYGIDVEDYLKNSKSFDMISAISYETKNQTEPYTDVHYYNEPFFDVGQKVFVYLKMNKSGEYIMSPHSFAIEKNEAKGPPQSVIWLSGPAKFQFNQVEEVIISGLVKKAYLYDSVQRGQDASINLKIFDKNNELLVSEKLNAKVDGTYEYPFQIKGEPRIPGKYSYEIQFGPDTMNGEFIIEVNPNLSAPLKQFRSGISISEIKCKENLQLVPKNNGNPACVKPSTVQKLIERGWAMLTLPPGEIPFGIEIPKPKNLTMEVISSDWCSGLSLDKIPPNGLTKRNDWFGASALIMTIGEEELSKVPHLKEMINEMKNSTGFITHEFDENVIVKQISGSGVEHSKIFDWLKENFEKQYAPRGDGSFSSFFQYNGDIYAIHFTQC